MSEDAEVMYTAEVGRIFLQRRRVKPLAGSESS